VFARLQTALLLVFRNLPPFARRWVVRAVTPSFTVGAICLIERSDGRVLLVKQVYRNAWGVPGGLTKRGEEIADCARREVFEEVGVRVDLLGEPAIVVDAKPQRVDVVYRARPVDGQDLADLRPSSPEIRELRWFALDELPELQHEAVSALAALARASAQAHQMHLRLPEHRTRGGLSA
jgi:ADP-ribose pyrophosphatase YjhB (NUDIX family)